MLKQISNLKKKTRNHVGYVLGPQCNCIEININIKLQEPLNCIDTFTLPIFYAGQSDEY